MTDEPRDILRAAGVERPEVEEYSHTIGKDDAWMLEDANAAILALARLVAKYKWQRDEAVLDKWVDSGYEPEDALNDPAFPGEFADLDRRWEEHDG